MSEAWVLCMPGFAEDRQRAVVLQILAAMQLPGIALSEYSLDAYENRSTITIDGPPAAVCEAAICAVGVAVEQIDLTCPKPDEQTPAYTGSVPRT